MPAPNSSITEDEIQAIISLEKFLLGDLLWKETPSGSAFSQASFNIFNLKEETIPGLTVELSYREGVIKSECKYMFTLFALRPPKKTRIYQLEVVPLNKISHKENGEKWYGPHQHFGEKAVEIPEAKYLKCGDHESWFKVFLRIANISHSGKYLPPGSKQGELPW